MSYKGLDTCDFNSSLISVQKQYLRRTRPFCNDILFAMWRLVSAQQGLINNQPTNQPDSQMNKINIARENETLVLESKNNRPTSRPCSIKISSDYARRRYWDRCLFILVKRTVTVFLYLFYICQRFSKSLTASKLE
jgi:hypothetical protein